MFRSFVRIGSIAASLVASVTVLGATAGHAQSGGYYVATPEAKPTRTSFIARDTVWTWRDSGFTARRGDSRDAVQCELVAKQTGRLSAFSVGGTAFDAAQLEKCNAKAR